MSQVDRRKGGDVTSTEDGGLSVFVGRNPPALNQVHRHTRLDPSSVPSKLFPVISVDGVETRKFFREAFVHSRL